MTDRILIITQKRFPAPHYHIRAWGSQSRPDLNYETSSIPYGLSDRYPYVDVSRVPRAPVPQKIMEAFNGSEETPRR